MDARTYLTLAEAARRAGVGERTVARWMRRGDLPVAAHAGRMRLLAAEDVDAIAAARRDAARARRRTP
jgi:excisionase family DNA binding protein